MESPDGPGPKTALRGKGVCVCRGGAQVFGTVSDGERDERVEDCRVVESPGMAQEA